MIPHPMEQHFQLGQTGSPAIRQSRESELKAAISDLIANLNDLVLHVRRIIDVLDESANARRPPEAEASSSAIEHRNSDFDEVAGGTHAIAPDMTLKLPLAPQLETSEPAKSLSEINDKIAERIRAAFAMMYGAKF